MNEAAFSRIIVAHAEDKRWKVYGIRNTKAGGLLSKSGLGFPDLLMLRDGRLMVVELKTDRGKFRAGQQSWLSSFAYAGIESYVWRPKDWFAGRIHPLLAAEAERE